MLVRFVVENFLSFQEEVEFNMLAGNFKAHKNHVYNFNPKILRAAALYGANGAGKSSLIKGIEYFKDIIENGRIDGSVNNKKFKLNDQCLTKPISFEIEIIYNQKFYSYGVRLNNSIVEEEWLYETGINTERKIFTRQTSQFGKVEISFDKKYINTPKSKLLIEIFEDNLLKPNELLLSKNKELKIEIITNVRSVLTDNIVIIHPQSKYTNFTPHISESEDFKTFSNLLLKTFDTGVNELKILEVELNKYFGEDDSDLKNSLIEDLDNHQGVLLNEKGIDLYITKNDNDEYIVKKLVSDHTDTKGKQVSFELTEESDGTQRLFDFIPALYGILSEDVTFIIDEIDQSIHPALLKAIISKAMNETDTKGQLIFTTHESNLLDLNIFRQDEIWFVEKNKTTKSTNMYSLSDFKPRYDLDIKKGYLQGRFGGIPFLGDLEKLNWNDYES
ncbi:ATP-binding protein [Myroides sp. DF42-4-2]|uniref:AAA family ATPase n=1 Tax=Myroides sp. DF42-4-2 TaxID=2746726 RepID=UPI002574D6AA|nr:ATP-binding protein [Myroides sp. DF42-4-2]MDM1408698.1 ATP-binding protein [Myroides sp. DF42-4-2]